MERNAASVAAPPARMGQWEIPVTVPHFPGHPRPVSVFMDMAARLPSMREPSSSGVAGAKRSKPRTRVFSFSARHMMGRPAAGTCPALCHQYRPVPCAGRSSPENTSKSTASSAQEIPSPNTAGHCSSSK